MPSLGGPTSLQTGLDRLRNQLAAVGVDAKVARVVPHSPVAERAGGGPDALIEPLGAQAA